MLQREWVFIGSPSLEFELVIKKQTNFVREKDKVEDEKCQLEKIVSLSMRHCKIRQEMRFEENCVELCETVGQRIVH